MKKVKTGTKQNVEEISGRL